MKQADGTTGTVTLVRNTVETRQMYNLTVDTAHTYYVGEGQWLVHNCEENLWSGIISPEPAQHILYGDVGPNPQQIPGLGGHMFPGGPTKTPFPAGWSENKILNNVADILTDNKTQWYASNRAGGLGSNGEAYEWRKPCHLGY